MAFSGHRFSLKTMLALWALTFQVSNGMELYSHGDPTAEEQYTLELINRARAAPAVEGRFLAGLTDPMVLVGITQYRVNLDRLKREFASYAPSPPLAFHADLLASADRHSRDMAQRNFQNHLGSDGSGPFSRMKDAGYEPIAGSENIYSNSVFSLIFSHAGFNIDWGPYDDGVQPGVGHRKNIMGVDAQKFREVGIGIAQRRGTDALRYGEWVVTQDFATRSQSPNFLVGVVFEDSNGNGTYDVGEGMPGVTVTPKTGSHFATTSASGGYAIPFRAASFANQVTFSGGRLTESMVRDFAMAHENVKLDLKLSVNETPNTEVRLEKSDTIAREKGSYSARSTTFRVIRTGSLTKDLVVPIRKSAGGAVGAASPNDYKIFLTKGGNNIKANPFLVKIPKGKNSALVRLEAIPDRRAEPTEVVTFRVMPSQKYRVARVSSVRLRITD